MEVVLKQGLHQGVIEDVSVRPIHKLTKNLGHGYHASGGGRGLGGTKSYLVLRLSRAH